MTKYLLLACFFLVSCLAVVAQPKSELMPFGNFDQWVEREIKESAVLGGKTRYVYAVAPNEKIRGEKAYSNKGGSPWSSSNVLAIVAGIVKTSNTVFPEDRDRGKCARLETRLETCKVLGIVNISVLASGTVYLGQTLEPVKGANNPYAKMIMGVPYTKRPKALLIDYKAKVATDNKLTKATGLHVSTLSGRDYCEAMIYLQKRWEDKDGTVYAKRVGTMRTRIGTSTPGWVNDYRMPIMYGDISDNSQYKPYMALVPEMFYTRNSQGDMTPIHEIGWGDESDSPTHMILMLSSGCHGAYTGALGNTFWVDNVRMEF